MKIPAMFQFCRRVFVELGRGDQKWELFWRLKTNDDINGPHWDDPTEFVESPRLLNSFYPVDNILNGIKAGALMLPGACVLCTG